VDGVVANLIPEQVAMLADADDAVLGSKVVGGHPVFERMRHGGLHVEGDLSEALEPGEERIQVPAPAASRAALFAADRGVPVSGEDVAGVFLGHSMAP